MSEREGRSITFSRKASFFESLFEVYILVYTEQNYKRNTFAPIFHELNSFSMYTRGLFLSNIVNKSVKICVSEHFSFAEIIHPPHRWGISRCWLDSMIIAQVCLRLATIKGHSKMCSFTTQHNATDVASFERACNLNADCRNVHQSCCPWIEWMFIFLP